MTTRHLRVFLGAFGDPGHAFPMLALGAELAARGHGVAFETWERWRGPVEASGMEFVRSPEYPVFPTRERPLSPYGAVLRATPVSRSAIAARAPDVVVHDVLTLAPALAGELEHVPVATLVPHLYPVAAPGFAPFGLGAQPPRTAAGRALWAALERPVEVGLRRGRDELNELRHRLGLPWLERLHGGLSEQLCLVGTFPALEYPRQWPGHVHVVGPLQWEPAASEVPLPPGPEPLVVVAPSTAQDPRQRLLRAALTGLSARRGPRVRVLATTNRRPLTAPARAGARTRLVDWVSYARMLPAASLVISHAGHGTLARALACGVPVLAVPHVGDMPENAARLAWSGAGLRLPWRLLSPLTVRLAVQRALDPDAPYAARAAQFGARAEARDGAARAAELVERLARR